MRHAQEPQHDIPSVMMIQNLAIMRGFLEIQTMKLLMMLARKNPIHGHFTICMATYGNG
jgi:hypothetical protein